MSASDDDFYLQLGPIDLSPREYPSEIEDELLTKLIGLAYEQEYGEAEEEEEEEMPYTGRPISVLSILRAADEEEDQDTVIVLLRSDVHHGSIVTSTGVDYRGCGYFFVRNKNFPEHEFHHQKLEDGTLLSWFLQLESTAMECLPSSPPVLM